MNKVLLLAFASFLSTEVLAGAWRYGCIGALPDGSVVNFNRATLAIVSTTQPARYAATADISKDIKVGDALDLNSGLQPIMEFKKANGDIIRLIETRSINTSHHERNESCTGGSIRTLTDDRMRKTYNFVIPGEATVSGVLRCYDINISTCG